MQPFDIKYTYSLLILLPGALVQEPAGLPGPRRGRLGARSAVYRAQRPATSCHRQQQGRGSFRRSPGRTVATAGNMKTPCRPRPSPVATRPTTTITEEYRQQSAAASPPAATRASNMFANPVAVFNEFRQPILGLDTNSGGDGPIRGFGYWNLDLTISKNFRIAERVNGDAHHPDGQRVESLRSADPTDRIAFAFVVRRDHQPVHQPQRNDTLAGWSSVCASASNLRRG